MFLHDDVGKCWFDIDFIENDFVLFVFACGLAAVNSGVHRES